MKNYNWKKISTSICYTPELLAKAVSASRKTIYKLITSGDLTPIKGGKNPYLIQGSDAQKCFKKLNARNKSPTLHPDDFYCMRCHKNRRAVKGSTHVEVNSKKGICPVCGIEMHKYC